MEAATIQFRGIERQLGYQDIPDGAMDELINLRHDRGRLEPVGTKEKIHPIPSNDYSKIWIHEADGITNYIGLEKLTYNLYYISSFIAAPTLIKQYTGDVQVTFVKRFMVVIHSSGMDRYLWRDDAYTLINYPDRPTLQVSAGSTIEYQTEAASTVEAILGKYYAKVNELSRDDGKLTGGIMLRMAYRLFDGSYVLQTLPQYVELGLKMVMTEQQVDEGSQDNDLRTTKFYASTMALGYMREYFDNVDADIFTHVAIFACRNESLYKFDEETFTTDVLTSKVTSLQSGNFEVDFKNIFDSVNPAYQEMADSESWYLVHESDIEEIKKKAVNPLGWYEAIDMKGFYQDYATRETLPVDQFSHHQLSAGYSMNYNSRLVLVNTSTQFGDYNPYFGINILSLPFFPSALGYTGEAARETYFLYTIKTSDGEKKVLTYYGQLGYSTKAGDPATLKYYRLPSVIGYPDARATKVEVIAKDGSIYYSMGSFNLKKSSVGNYAYYISDKFHVDSVQNNDSEYNYRDLYKSAYLTSIVNMNLYLTAESQGDENRVQISEVNNPYFFPAENSYQVGTGKITACASNSEPLSTGQFGEYPLIVFTTKGIWGMMQGQGNILFSSIVPVSGDVANEDSILSIGNGVVYTTDKGIYLLMGRNVKELSSGITGSPNTDFQANINYQFYLNSQLHVQIVNKLSSVDILVYISGAKMGFDKLNNELYVTNPNYPYSYVFNFDTMFWYKISESFNILINYYPRLYALRETNTNPAENGIISLSEESYDNTIDILLTSQPLKLGAGNTFKTIQRMFLRTIFETADNFNAGFYYFASSDLINWQRITGLNDIKGKKRDIRLARAGSKFKYFIVVFAGKVYQDAYIGSLDIEYQKKMNNKLR